MYRQSEKNLLSGNISPTCPYNMVNLRPTSSWEFFFSLGDPSKFQRVSRLGSVLYGTLLAGVSQTAALNRGRHLYLAGRPSRWALAHISSLCWIKYQQPKSGCCVPSKFRCYLSKKFNVNQTSYRHTTRVQIFSTTGALSHNRLCSWCMKIIRGTFVHVVGDFLTHSTTQVSRYQENVHSLTPRLCGCYTTSLINCLHFLRSIVSSLHSCRVWQSFSVTSLEVFFGLPFGLSPSTK